MSKTKPFAVFDLETDPFSHGRFPRPFAAGFFDGKTYVKWWGSDCVAKLAAVLKSFPGWCYAHNGGKFDTHYLLDYLLCEGKPVKFVKINGRIAKLPFGACEIRDSYLLLPVALSKLDKLKIDYAKLESNCREQHKAEILRYLEFDCRSLHDKLTKFFEEYGRGLTLANRAFTQLGKLEETPAKTSLDYDAKFREFYYGGRVQAIQPGEHKGPLVYLDINSAYPFAMNSRHWFAPDYVTLPGLPKTGIENCMIDFDGESRGALPFRDEKSGELSFPNRSARWKVTGWEFITGVQLGRISPKKIHAVHRPFTCRNFSTYVSHFWKLKDEATKNKDTVRREFAKLMLNSAYGKFALNPRKFTENIICPFGHTPEPDANGDWGPPHTTNFERGFSEFQRPQKLKSTPCYNVATAASITGFVRAYLLRALHEVREPIYCDTDSIICRGPNRIRLGDSLGEWKTEANLRFAAIGGKKLYALETTEEKDGQTLWKTACKGAHATPEEIIRAVRGESITWKNDAPSFSLGTRSKLFVERKIQRTSVERIDF